MRQALDRFVLGIPVLFLKQYPYAWIALVALWTWPPKLALVFLLIVLCGILMLNWRSHAWISNLRREYASRDGKIHVDTPGMDAKDTARKILILISAAGLAGWLFDGQFGLHFWQILLIVAGFTLLYQDNRFLGASTIYAITDRGIGIYFVPGHLDYRLFLEFKEIARIERREYRRESGWDFFARIRDGREGLLLIPRNPDGFSKRIGKVFIAPKDLDAFIRQLPPGHRPKIKT
ncbi:MAG: hypothetical protein FJZ87_18295 [Chloroflexi bacterium]|nr:hypothetical protein [Chloroflexota bacterium]